MGGREIILRLFGETGITPTLILPRQGGGNGLVVKKMPRARARGSFTEPDYILTDEISGKMSSSLVVTLILVERGILNAGTCEWY